MTKVPRSKVVRKAPNLYHDNSHDEDNAWNGLPMMAPPTFHLHAKGTYSSLANKDTKPLQLKPASEQKSKKTPDEKIPYKNQGLSAIKDLFEHDAKILAHHNLKLSENHIIKEKNKYQNDRYGYRKEHSNIAKNLEQLMKTQAQIEHYRYPGSNVTFSNGRPPYKDQFLMILGRSNFRINEEGFTNAKAIYPRLQNLYSFIDLLIEKLISNNVFLTGLHARGKVGEYNQMSGLDQLAAIQEILNDIDFNIKGAREKIISGELSVYDLSPVHQQMASSPKAAGQYRDWRTPGMRDAMQTILQEKKTSDFWKGLGLDALTVMLAVGAGFANPVAAIAMISSNIAISGAKAKSAWDAYSTLNTAYLSRTQGSANSLVSRDQVANAKFDVITETIGLLMDASGGGKDILRMADEISKFGITKGVNQSKKIITQKIGNISTRSGSKLIRPLQRITDIASDKDWIKYLKIKGGYKKVLEEAKGLSGDESAKWLEKMHQFRQRIYKNLREHIKNQGGDIHMTGTPAATSDFDLSIVGPKPEKLRVEAYNHLKNKFGINSKEILNDMLDMNIFGESRLAHAYDMLPPTIREEAASEILKFSDELILRRGLKNAQDNGDADTVRIILKYMKGHGFTNHAPLPTISSTKINATRLEVGELYHKMENTKNLKQKKDLLIKIGRLQAMIDANSPDYISPGSIRKFVTERPGNVQNPFAPWHTNLAPDDFLKHNKKGLKPSQQAELHAELTVRNNYNKSTTDIIAYEKKINQEIASLNKELEQTLESISDVEKKIANQEVSDNIQSLDHQIKHHEKAIVKFKEKKLRAIQKLEEMTATKANNNQINSLKRYVKNLETKLELAEESISRLKKNLSIMYKHIENSEKVKKLNEQIGQSKTKLKVAGNVKESQNIRNRVRTKVIEEDAGYPKANQNTKKAELESSLVDNLGEAAKYRGTVEQKDLRNLSKYTARMHDILEELAVDIKKKAEFKQLASELNLMKDELNKKVDPKRLTELTTRIGDVYKKTLSEMEDLLKSNEAKRSKLNMANPYDNRLAQSLLMEFNNIYYKKTALEATQKFILGISQKYAENKVKDVIKSNN